MISIDTKLFFGAAAVLGGGYGLVAAFRDLSRAFASEEWPQVEGEILESEVASGFSGADGMFAPRVRYRYMVGEREIVGDCISFGGPVQTSLRWPAEIVAERYQKGRTVSVRVCPTDRNLSVLEPGSHWFNYLVLVACAVFVGLGISVLMARFGWIQLPDWFHVR
jgi:Protein of unknown function (DUF3592)